MAILSVSTRQSYLKALGYTVSVTGKEDLKTKAAYKEFQREHMTRAKDIDGIYGQNTDNALRSAYKIMLKAKNFTANEFRCNCGKYCCGWPVVIDAKIVALAQDIRNACGPTYITSGLRCQAWNDAQAASIKASYHVKGKAIDYYNSKTSTAAGRKAQVDRNAKKSDVRFSYCGDGYAKLYNKTYPYSKVPAMGQCVHVEVV